MRVLLATSLKNFNENKTQENTIIKNLISIQLKMDNNVVKTVQKMVEGAS